MMTTKLKQSLGLALATAAMMAVAAPAMACNDLATRLQQVKANDSDPDVTRAALANSSAVPHRPETDVNFPPAQASEFTPIQAHAIAMGGIQGIAYYTVESDGLRVVATVSAGDAVLRVISTLATDQSMALAVPGAEGETGMTVEFTRHGNCILVSQSPPVTH
jgi:hypothetical protein